MVRWQDKPANSESYFIFNIGFWRLVLRGNSTILAHSAKHNDRRIFTLFSLSLIKQKISTIDNPTKNNTNPMSFNHQSMGTGMNGQNMWMLRNGMNSNHAMNGQYNSNMMARPQHCGHGNNGHGHKMHYASSNQSQSYFSSNDLALQMRIIMRDYPLVYQHTVDQALLIREQQVLAIQRDRKSVVESLTCTC